MFEQPLINRAQMPCGATDPIGNCQTIELDSMEHENLRFAVKRQVIGRSGDRRRGEGPSVAKPALLNRAAAGARRLEANL